MVTGKERRLRRLLGEDGKTLLIAVDHSLTLGAVGGLTDMASAMGAAVAGGADGVVSHRGSAARCMPVQRQTGLVVHLSGATALSPRSELKTRVCTPEAALALGADALSAHITLGGGSAEDRAALADLGSLAADCDRLGIPLLVMTYVRTDAPDPGPAVLHAARIAAELGADIVKVAHPGEEHVADLAATVPAPVVLAGGQADSDWEEFCDSAKAAMGAGVAGLCVGRRVFGAADPVRATAGLRAIVHGEG